MDLSIYQEHRFPGKTTIGASLAIQGAIWLLGFIVPYRETPVEFQRALAVVIGLSSISFLIGFWRAVVGKGYPKLLFLAGFTGIIGAVIIFYLPDRRLSTGRPDDDCRASGTEVAKSSRAGREE